jgi:class 3 adenylate cyclase
LASGSTPSCSAPCSAATNELCTDAIARHGGCVEKFIGDAVVAVFGVPDAREDDALRAVRAATEIRDRFDALRAELEAQLGLELAVQIGVHSGVAIVPRKVAPEGSAVTGDTTNRAARLQQSAGPARSCWVR